MPARTEPDNLEREAVVVVVGLEFPRPVAVGTDPRRSATVFADLRALEFALLHQIRRFPAKASRGHPARGAGLCR
jgi:hypothetical protein